MRQAQTRAPARADLHKLQGDIALKIGDRHGARAAYRAALDLDQGFVQVLLDLGKLHELGQCARRQQEAPRPPPARLDGRRRLYYFRNFPKLPLIIMVAEGEEDVYAAWHRRAVIIGSSMGVLAIGFIILSLVLAAQFLRRMRAESELQLA